MDSKYLESMQELGLQVGFTLEELKKKKKELVKEYHPDKYNNQPESVRKLAEEKMKKINEAYSYLEKNFGNNNNSSNTSNNENMNTKSENTIKFFMSNGEVIEYFSFYLADLKKELKRKFQPLASKIFRDYADELSGKFDWEPIFDEVMVLKDMTEEFFAKNLLKINAIKESDKTFLEESIIKINTLIKKVDSEIEESTFDLLFEEYRNKNFALLGAYRHYLFTEKIKQWMMEIYYCIDKHFKKIDKANYNMRNNSSFGEAIFSIGLGSFQKFNSNYTVKENLQNLFENYSDRVFNIFAELIYLGYTENEVLNEVTRLENYRRMVTEPNFYLENCKTLDEECINMFFNYFPNEKNNVLLEAFLALKNKNINQIKNLSSRIENITYNQSFEIIVNRLFPNFKNKKQLFFTNIKLLLNENSRKNMLSFLKNVKENLEKNNKYSFWGLNNENQDLKMLYNEYHFLNNNELNKFIEESDKYLNDIFLYKQELKNMKNAKKEEEKIKIQDNNQNSSNSNNKVLYIILPIIGVLIFGIILYFVFFKENNDYQEVYTQSTTSYSQAQPQQAVAKQSVVENNTERQEVAQQNNIQTSSNYDYDLEVLEKVYDEVINRGNESYLESFPSEELAIIRNTLYARKGYQFKKKEYQEYFGQKSWYNPTTTNQNILTKDEERLANIIKGYENNANTRTSNTAGIGYENKFGRVVNDKYVGGSFIDFLRNADQNEYYYLRDQFWEILDTMYVTEDNKTYYYLNDIIDQLETKADWDNSSRVISLEVKGNKMYYTVGFPKGYNANTPSWIQFEIFERKFNDGIGLRTAHVSCAINGVEYKDWEAVNAIFR